MDPSPPNVTPRRLPFVITPLPDEPFDSWLETYAAGYGASLGEVALALGLFEQGEQTGPAVSVVHGLATELSPRQLQNLEVATGEPEHVYRESTRVVFARHVIRLTKNGRISPSCPGTGLVPRYCPACLADSNGRWRLSWQFPFGFACGRHRTLLIDHCPSCRKPPRERGLILGAVPVPGRCLNAIRGNNPRRCETDLRSADDGQEVSTQILATQRMMLRVVSAGVARFGIYAASPQPALRVFEDIAVLSRAGRRALNEGCAPDWLEHDATVDLWLSAGPTPDRHRLRPASSVDVAVGNHIAHQALLGEERIAGLLKGRVGPHTGLDRFSPVLQHEVTRALGRRRRPTAFLQAEGGGTDADVNSRAAKLPAVLWAVWTAQLAPRRTNSEIAGAALAAATVFTGTRLTHAAAQGLLDPTLSTRQVTHIMRQLGANRPEARTVRAIVQLAQYLDSHATPVDYARRRQLDYTKLLPESQWREICAKAGVKAGSAKRWNLARAELYRQLTGNRVALAPLTGPGDPLTLAALNQFRSSAPLSVLHELDRVAQSFLTDRGITEPVTWMPSLGIAGLVETESAEAPGIEWPPAQPVRSQIDRSDVARDYRSGRSLRSIADGRDAARQTIGRVLAEQDEPIRRGRARISVDADWLRRRYLVDKRTIAEIAAEASISHATVKRRMTDSGIVSRPRGSGSRVDAIRPDRRAGTSKLLTAALTGHGAAQRAQRFVVVARHPTLTSAAKELGVASAVLSSQMKLLSVAVGGQVLRRAERRRPLALTPLGVRLVRELERALRDLENGTAGSQGHP